MRDLVVKCIRPDRRVGDGGGDAGVVDEAKLAHHQELPVPTSAQEGNPQTSDVLHVNTAKPVGCSMDEMDTKDGSRGNHTQTGIDVNRNG